MIPKVKKWRVRVLEKGRQDQILFIDAPTKLLARLNVRYEYPGTWGKTIKISVAKAA